jgi:hypothetical protein
LMCFVVSLSLPWEEGRIEQILCIFSGNIHKFAWKTNSARYFLYKLSFSAIFMYWRGYAESNIIDKTIHSL